MRPRAPDRMSTERASGQAGESGLEPVIGFVSRVLVPGGLLTAVLYYFGYVREQALFSHFGIDLGIVGFSTTDYLVRSTSTVFFPLATVLVLGVVAVAGHYLLVYLLPRMDDRWRQAAWIILGATALVLLAAGVAGLQRRADPAIGPLVAPTALAGGALLLEYTVEMVPHPRSRAGAAVDGPGLDPDRTPWPAGRPRSGRGLLGHHHGG